MIDFTNKSLIKLKPISTKEGEDVSKTLLIPNENVTFAFSSMRDKLVFTSKRIL